MTSIIHKWELFRALGGGLFVMAQTSDDMAFVHSSWDDGIEPWRFQLPYESYSGPYIAHTIFDEHFFERARPSI